MMPGNVVSFWLFLSCNLFTMHYNILSLTVSSLPPCRYQIPYTVYYISSLPSYLKFHIQFAMMPGNVLSFWLFLFRNLFTMHYNTLSLTITTVFPCRSKIPYSLYYDAWHCVNSTELIPNNLPDRDCFEEYIQSLGITANTHVVVYDRIGGLPAWKSKRNTKPSFRTWWLFRVKYYKLIISHMGNCAIFWYLSHMHKFL